MYLYVTKPRISVECRPSTCFEISVNGQITFVFIIIVVTSYYWFASLSGQNQFDCPPECSCLDSESTVWIPYIWIPYGVILTGV